MTEQLTHRNPTKSGIRAFLAGAFLLTLGFQASAGDAGPTMIRFGVEPWPGVTVKSEVAAQLLEATGYATKQRQVNTPFMLNGVATGELEVGLGGWYPVSKEMIDSMVDDNKVIKLAANLEGALSGVAVPAYVHEAGVDSMEDLQRHADRFDHKIYGIESGSTWNAGVKRAIKEDRYGLGDWTVVPSSVSAMLTQVGRAAGNKEWIAFYGWRPHWMNIKYDLYYLEAPSDSEIAHTESVVYTIVAPDFSETHPNVARFFRQYKVEPRIQSRWIYEFKYNDRDPSAVAREWIASHMDTVRQWLDGVKTVDDGPAIDAIEAEYAQ